MRHKDECDKCAYKQIIQTVRKHDRERLFERLNKLEKQFFQDLNTQGYYEDDIEQIINEVLK